jgi:hypothetical protein
VRWPQQAPSPVTREGGERKDPALETRFVSRREIVSRWVADTAAYGGKGTGCHERLMTNE